MTQEQIKDAVKTCQGRPIAEVLKLFTSGHFNADDITSLAEFYSCDRNIYAVAKCLSTSNYAQMFSNDDEQPDGSCESEDETDEDTDNSTENEESEGENSPFCFNPLVFAIRPFYQKAIDDDELFSKEVKEKESRSEKPKSLAECADYIYGEALRYAEKHRENRGGCSMGLAGCEDAQITAMIKHYYDEDNIVIYKAKEEVKAVIKTAPETKPADTKKPKEKAKPAKKSKKKAEHPSVIVPMVRPASEKDAKRSSKEQAKSVIVMDLFAGMDDDE